MHFGLLLHFQPHAPAAGLVLFSILYSSSIEYEYKNGDNLLISTNHKVPLRLIVSLRNVFIKISLHSCWDISVETTNKLTVMLEKNEGE